MSPKPVVPSIPALRDVQAAVDYYTDEAGAAVAAAFVGELQRVFELIGRAPGTGSPRYADDIGNAGLRSRQLRRYPYLVFYHDRGDRIDVWRVLHAQRDIPAHLGTRNPDSSPGG